MQNETEGQSTASPVYAQPPNPYNQAYAQGYPQQPYPPPQGYPQQQYPPPQGYAYPPPGYAGQPQPYPPPGYAQQPYVQGYPAQYVVPQQGVAVVVAQPELYPTCCGRYNYILWGTSIRRVVSAFMIAFAVAGLVMIIAAKRSCPGGCSEQNCYGVDGHYYDCYCGGYCKDKSATGPVADVGIALLNIGVWYFLIASFVACCCFRR